MRRIECGLWLALAGLCAGHAFTPPLQAQKVDTAKQKKDKPIRLDKSGLVLKAIVKTSNAKLYDAPGGKVLQELEPFLIFTRLYADDGKASIEKDGKRYYRVGDLDNKEEGWVCQTDVFDWGTRFVLTPKPNTEYVVYDKKGGSEAAEPKTDEDLAKMEKIATCPPAPKDQTAMVPILEKPVDSRDPVYRVAFMTAKSRTSTTSTVQPQITAKDVKLEVVFVVDTTNSMTPLLEGTKEVVRRTVKSLGDQPNLKGKVRFGLVEYQDLVKGLVPARVVSKLTDDLDTFQAKLKPLKVATIGSEDTPEDVLAGLKMALDDSGWEKVSSKHIVLLGDASAQLNEGARRNPKNTTNESIAGILALGRNKAGGEAEKQAAQVTFHAVLAKSVDPDDHKRAIEHFKAIAANNGEVPGMYRWVEDPNKEADQEGAVKEVVQKIKEGFDLLALGLKDPGKLQVDSTRGPVAQGVFRLLKTLNLKADEIAHKGYGAERNEKGEQVAFRKVFVSKVDLERLVSQLDFLYRSLEAMVDPAERIEVTAILYVLQAAAAGAVAGQTVKPDSKLGELISGLPLQTDALRVTPAQLSAFTEKQYRDWLNKLKESRNIADNLIKRPQSQWQVIERPGGKKESINFFLLGQLP